MARSEGFSAFSLAMEIDPSIFTRAIIRKILGNVLIVICVGAALCPHKCRIRQFAVFYRLPSVQGNHGGLRYFPHGLILPSRIPTSQSTRVDCFVFPDADRVPAANWALRKI